MRRVDLLLEVTEEGLEQLERQFDRYQAEDSSRNCNGKQARLVAAAIRLRAGWFAYFHLIARHVLVLDDLSQGVFDGFGALLEFDHRGLVRRGGRL